MLFLTAGLVAFGLLMVYSASYIYAQERAGDGFHFVRKHVGFAALGFAALALASRGTSALWRGIAPIGLAVATGLLALTFAPGIGARSGGAQRWLQLGGLGFQPAELAKFALIAFLAWRLDRNRNRLDRFTAAVPGALLFMLPALAMLLMQPDFGSALVVSAVACLVLMASGVRWAHLAWVGMAVGGCAIFLFRAAPYRMARLAAYLDPWADPSGAGFQLLQSTLGFHTGGLWGTGLGNGKEKLFYLPQAHNDFLFSVIGEELGLAGVLVVLVAFGFLLLRGLSVSWKRFQATGDLFGYALSVGILYLIATQALVNMAVGTGLFPTKGLVLPFLSYGGSALVADLAAIGVWLGIQRKPWTPATGGGGLGA